LRHTFSAAEFDGLLQELVRHNRANGRPDVAEELTGLFSKVEPDQPCRVIPLRRKEDPDSPGFSGRRLNLVR
jgi:hypothetical protein